MSWFACGVMFANAPGRIGSHGSRQNSEARSSWTISWSGLPRIARGEMMCGADVARGSRTCRPADHRTCQEPVCRSSKEARASAVCPADRDWSRKPPPKRHCAPLPVGWLLSVSPFDQRIGSKAEQAIASVPTEAVVFARPGRISSGNGSNAARIARLAYEIERMGGELREGLGWVSLNRGMSQIEFATATASAISETRQLAAIAFAHRKPCIKKNNASHCPFAHFGIGAGMGIIAPDPALKRESRLGFVVSRVVRWSARGVTGGPEAFEPWDHESAAVPSPATHR